MRDRGVGLSARWLGLFLKVVLTLEVSSFNSNPARETQAKDESVWWWYCYFFLLIFLVAVFVVMLAGPLLLFNDQRSLRALKTGEEEVRRLMA